MGNSIDSLGVADILGGLEEALSNLVGGGTEPTSVAQCPPPLPPQKSPQTPADEVVEGQGGFCSVDDGGWGNFTPVAQPRFADAQHPDGFPTSDGFPLYRQGDKGWRDQQIGTKDHTSNAADGNSLWSKGCALSSSAMMLSGMTGQTITPAMLDDHMKAAGAMSGNAINDWSAIGRACSPPVAVSREHGVTAAQLGAELARGNPVVIGVHYSGTGGGTQHWIAVTGRTEDGGFRASDPATGKAIVLHLGADGQLHGDSKISASATHAYTFTGDAAVFHRPAQNA
jgi:hypothetical protein